MSESQTYDFNFFKPKSAFAGANARLIGTIVIIWALAVFGFHFLLKAIEKPVPEKQLATFEQVWPKAMDKTASPEELRELSLIYLNLLGRQITLRSDQNFKLCFTSTVYDLLPEDEKPSFLAITGKDLPELKTAASSIAAGLGIETGDILNQVIPYGLVSYDGTPVDSEILAAVPDIMNKYLVHNRSVLTDTSFLGFPFHYFYTAVFLLILFVVLCLVYCKIFDRISVKYGMEDDEVK